MKKKIGIAVVALFVIISMIVVFTDDQEEELKVDEQLLSVGSDENPENEIQPAPRDEDEADLQGPIEDEPALDEGDTPIVK